ncbi:hypothetical protein QVD17_12306 [Tagetes erecta]|uniref:Uncharacterized protein n=1 Tax=Tagetes erecta TaxID=13708 RepID=A0AAD8P2U8_TARER|nr:hypothetical protein QVD17_12306 [Tagetes erecta]
MDNSRKSDVWTIVTSDEHCSQQITSDVRTLLSAEQMCGHCCQQIRCADTLVSRSEHCSQQIRYMDTVVSRSEHYSQQIRYMDIVVSRSRSSDSRMICGQQQTDLRTQDSS